MEKITGVIFAGGYGKRLLPLTETTPKPLLELRSGYTILDKQLMDMKYAGINEAYLLVGHLGDKIKAHFGKSCNGVRLNYLTEDKPMGTLWALSNALKRIKSDVVVRNGDVVTDINIKNLISVAKKSDNLITIAMVKMRSPYGIVEFNDMKITSFREKPLLDIYINAGIYYIKKEAFRYFEEEYDKKEVEKTVFPKLADERRVGPYREEGVFWCSVDGIKDLEAVLREYANKIDKPWGYEKTIVNNEKYLVKELYVKKGFKTSLHYHPNKDESLHALEGEGYIEFPRERKREEIGDGSVVRIEPKRIHSIVATENLKIYEYSTPHPEDTVRVKDFYSR